MFGWVSRRAKEFLLTWIVPPGVAAAQRRRRLPKLQKFWSGTPVPAPPRELAYFAAAGFAAETYTRDDDSRPCALVGGSARLPLPDGAAGEAVQFALSLPSAVAPRDSDATVRIGERTVVARGLSSASWLDLRVDVDAGATAIDIVSESPVLVTYPRSVRVRSRASARVRHVVVLVLDGWTSRLASELHPTEAGTPLTPSIDRFFAGGFEAPCAYSNGEWTMPTSASFFTGLYTARHRSFHPYAESTLPGDRELLAERFQAAGYHTLCCSTGNRLTPAYGHHRGFDRFIYHFPEPGYTTRAYDPAVWLNELTGHLDAHWRDRTFSYVHLPDVHPPWNVGPVTRSFSLGRRGGSIGLDLSATRTAADADEQGRQLYLLRLHEIDRLLGGVFDFIEHRINDETVVVLTADHGTPWQHLRPNRPSDEPYLVDDRTAISLKLRGPGVPARRHGGLAAPNIDLLPTLYALAGFDIPADIDGRDLLADGYNRDVIISESLYGGVYEVAVRDGRRVYVEKYPLDEERVQLRGPATYARLFRAGESDYSASLDVEPGLLKTTVASHISRCHLA
jgi:hypothetical protein